MQRVRRCQQLLLLPGYHDPTTSSFLLLCLPLISIAILQCHILPLNLLLLSLLIVSDYLDHTYHCRIDALSCPISSNSTSYLEYFGFGYALMDNAVRSNSNILIGVVHS